MVFEAIISLAKTAYQFLLCSILLKSNRKAVFSSLQLLYEYMLLILEGHLRYNQNHQHKIHSHTLPEHRFPFLQCSIFIWVTKAEFS